MAVVSLIREDKSSSNPLYLARKEYGLSLSQAAVALGMSPTQVERDELRAKPTVDVNQARQAFEVFIATHLGSGAGKNLLFGQMPLRVARDILGMSVAQIAARHGMSESQWRKMECHARLLEKPVLDQIQQAILEHFDGLCR